MSILQIVLETGKLILPWVVRIVPFALLLLIYLSTRENSGFRGVATYLLHAGAIGLGWYLGRWLGILFISVPILIFYYYMLFHLAMVVVPAADPDSWQEWRQRFLLLMRYQWGFQFPISMVPHSFGRGTETRIQGELYGSYGSGLVWARSHQVVALTTGLSFAGARQSGTIFTRLYERPFSVIDLRTQLRTSTLEVVSGDGIPFKAVLFASFAVDREKWDLGLYHRLVHENPLLKNAREPDCTRGTYPFSRPRLRVLAGTIGVKSSIDSSENKTIDWDESVLCVIEQAARQVLSQRKLDELWQIQEGRMGLNAMDDIAAAIKDQCFFELKLRGVHLYSSRIVDFEFTRKEVPEGKEDEVKRKQITAWSADWQREAEQTRAEGRIEADLLKQEARAYAYTNLLTAVAEGLQETRLLNPHLPRYVIAVRFISAMERLIEEQPESEEVMEARASLANARKMLPWAGEQE